MADTSRPDRRRSPRHPTKHCVDGMTLDGRIEFRGLLCDLTAEGCRLHLDTRIPPGSAVEVRCNIAGLGLGIRGEVLWTEAATGGNFHGTLLTGFASEEDALFHRQYVSRLSRRASAEQE